MPSVVFVEGFEGIPMPSVTAEMLAGRQGVSPGIVPPGRLGSALNPMDTGAGAVVEVVDSLPAPSWWDQELIPGVRNLYLALGVGLLVVVRLLRRTA